MVRRLLLSLPFVIVACTAAPAPVGGDAIESLLGRWDFEADRLNEPDISGYFVLTPDPASHRLAVPNTPLDSMVHASRPVLRGDRFVWDGELDTAFGRGSFRVDAAVSADTMRGTTDVPGAGRYRFTAVRRTD